MRTDALGAQERAPSRLLRAVGGSQSTDAGAGVSYARLRELSHDVRHPCATIRALAAAIEAEAELPEAVRRRLGQIVAEARRVDQLCTDVLRPSAPPAARTRVDSVVRDIASAHPRLAVDAAVPLPAAIDELALRRVLWNLIDNAVRAAGPHGHVTVASWRRGSEVVVEVGDDGPGFGAAGAGMAGLGLGIVTSLVERAGGRVEICPLDAGGVAVRVVLPAADGDGEVRP